MLSIVYIDKCQCRIVVLSKYLLHVKVRSGKDVLCFPLLNVIETAYMLVNPEEPLGFYGVECLIYRAIACG